MAVSVALLAVAGIAEVVRGGEAPEDRSYRVGYAQASGADYVRSVMT